MKLLALDMDGTCLNSYSKISNQTIEALYQARNSGIELIPTTGRALSCIPHQLRRTGLFRYVISSNGAVVVDLKERKTLFRSLVPADTALSIIEAAKGPDLKMAAHIHHEYLLQGHFLSLCGHVIYGQDASRAKDVPDLSATIRSRSEAVEELQFFFLTKKARERTRHIVSEFPELSSAFTSYYAEIYSSKASKGTALSAVADRLSVSKQDIACIGDGENDLSMFEQSGLSFAMGNAVPELKASADMIVSSNNQNGVAEAIYYLISAVPPSKDFSQTVLGWHSKLPES